MTCQVITKKSGTQKLNDAVKRLKKAAVLVGIAKGSDKDKREDGISNADLGLIHEFGAPSAGIPPRPFLIPSVEQSEGIVKKRFAKAMNLALKGEEQKTMRILEATGIEVASEVKKYMSTANFAPLKPATIENRKYSRQTKSQRVTEIAGGNSSLIQPLINTGSLRNAIDSYVEK